MSETVCTVCEQPCDTSRACWFEREDGTTSEVDFCCSDRCVERWDASHWLAGPVVHSGEVFP